MRGYSRRVGRFLSQDEADDAPRRVATSNNFGGKITDHAYEQTRSGSGLRTQTGGKGTEKGKVVVDKELKKGFLLIVKQPALFSALLPVVAPGFLATP